MSSSTPTLLELLDALSEVEADWYILGLRLCLSAGTLNGIKETHHGVVEKCMNQMLQKWLGKYPEKGWSDIVMALRAMERNDIANHVAKKHCSDSSTHSPLGTCAGVVSAIYCVSDRWYSIGTQLGIDCDQLDAISTEQSGDVDRCLINMVTCWLHDTSRYGPPTWEKLVHAIGSPAGGNNTQLAIAIAEKHNVPIHELMQTHMRVTQSDHVSPLSYPSPLSPSSLTAHATVSQSSDTFASSGDTDMYPKVVVERQHYIENHPPLVPLPPDLADIEDELDELINQFEANFYSTRRHFKDSDVPIIDVCAFVRCRKKLYFNIAREQAKKELTNVIEAIKTYEHLFCLLEEYVSWFNFVILTSLVDTFLEKARDLQNSWKSYEEKLKEYLSLGKGVRLVSNPTLRGIPQAVGTKVMIIKVEREDIVYTDLSIFHKAVAKALNQSDFYLYLCTIGTGCVELRFVIPDFLFDEIFPLTSEQVHVTLPALGIIAVHCDTYHIELPVTTSPLHYNYVQNVLSEFHDRLSIENNSSPLHDACFRGLLSEVQWILLKFGYDKYRRGFHGWTPLHSAAYGGHLDVLQYLVDNRCDPNVCDDDDVSLLHVSSYKGHLHVITYLLDTCNVPVNAVDSYNTTAAMYAALGGQDETLNLIISKYQCNTDVCSKAGYNLSLLACQSGQIKVVHTLESLNVFNPRSLDYMYRCVIHYACIGNSVEMLEYLIEQYSLDLAVEDGEGATGLHVAARFGAKEVVQYMMKIFGPQSAVETGSCICNPFYYAFSGEAAAFGGKIFRRFFVTLDSTIIRILNEPVHTISSPTLVLANNWSPLKVSERVSLVSWMLEQCITLPSFDVNAIYYAERRYADCACGSGNFSLLRLLVKLNVDVTLVDDGGISPLHCAADAGSVSLFRYLAKHHDLDVGTKSYDGAGPLHYASTTGSINMVKYLASVSDVNDQDHDGLLALHYSSLSGHCDIACYFIEEHNLNPSATDKLGSNALHKACESGNKHLVKYLLTEKAMDANITNSNQFTTLHYAAMSGNLSLVQLLVQQYMLDPHQFNAAGCLPFHYAADEGHTNIMQYFIDDCHINVATQTNTGHNAVHYATRYGHYHSAYYLSTVYIDGFNVPNKNGMLPIHTACQSGNLQLVEYLVDVLHCDIQSLTSSHQTCAVFACMSGNLYLLKLLATKYMLNLAASDAEGFTLLHYAAEHGHNRIIEWLVKVHKLDPHSTSNDATTTLHKAASGGVTDTVKYLYKIHSLDINSTTTSNRYTPLHSATIGGHIPIVQYLTGLPQCNITAKDLNGSTVLHLCSQYGHLKLLEHYMANHSVLLENNNLYAYRDLQLSPLEVGSFYGNLPIVKYLLEKSEFNQDSNKRKAFEYAFQNGHSDTMYHIFKNLEPTKIPLYMEIQDGNSSIPLHVACGSGDLDAVTSFIDAIAVNPFLLNRTNSNGYNVFHFAATNGSLPVVERLVHAINILSYVYDTINMNNLLEAKTREGHTPLHLSCLNGHIEVVKSLATLCPSTILMVDNNGRGLMHAAAHTANVKLIEYLADEHNLKTDASDNSGMTPLHGAAEIGNFIAFKVLVNYIGESGNCNPKSNNGRTPFSLACENGHALISSYLVEDLKISVDTASTTSTTYTPLHLAASNNKVATVQLLVDTYSVDVNCTLPDQNNSTPLHLATIEGHVAVVLYLSRLSPRCNVTAALSDGSTVLHLSTKHGHIHLVKHFAKNHKQLLAIADNDQNTPLHIVCSSENLEMVRVLVEAVAEEDPSILTLTNSDDSNSIHCAAKLGNLPIMNFIINCLESRQLTKLFEARNSLHQTPLHVACLHRHNALVKSLASVCPSTAPMVDINGRGLMHAAAETANEEIMKYLAEEHNLSDDTPDRWGLTPAYMLQLVRAVQQLAQLA